MTWAATQAKAKFSEMLDLVKDEGPQRIQRRKERFVVLDEKKYDELVGGKAVDSKPFVSAWDMLRPSWAGKYGDVEFPRAKSKARKVDLG